jgi:hypothetical protein
LQAFEGERIDFSGWMTAGAKGPKAAGAEFVQETFGHNAAGGIAGAEKQDIENFFAHWN